MGKKHFTGKKWALIACCEENDLTVFEGVRAPIARAAWMLQWELLGEVLVPGVMNEGDITKNRWLPEGRGSRRSDLIFLESIGKELPPQISSRLGFSSGA